MELFGRRKIYVDRDIDIGSEEFLKVLESCFLIHNKNKEEIEYLYKYYTGNQDILYRDNKKVRPEIDERVVENVALKIINFKKGYLFGEPIQYIKNSNKSQMSKSKTDEQTKDNQLLLVNEYSQESGKHSLDKTVGFWGLICGVGYAICLANQKETSKIPFILKPLEPASTFIAYSNDFMREPVFACTYTEKVVGSTEKPQLHMTIYTQNNSYEMIVNGEFNSFKITKEHPNLLREIPIVEFNFNETSQGAFEPVIPLLNALNVLNSDRLNDVQQAVQWFMTFINCDIDSEQYDEFRKKGVIIAKGDPTLTPQINVISTTLNQEQIQVLKNDIVQRIYEITDTPDRNASAGGNTGQSLILGEGWSGAEANARDIETKLIPAQKQLLNLMLLICKSMSNSDPVLNNCNVEEIDVKFTRNRTDNLLVKTQALTSSLQAGVAPLIAFELCGLFSDPQKAYELSKEFLKKYDFDFISKQGEFKTEEDKANAHTTNDDKTKEIISKTK